jgi:hypothetical protein
VPTSVGTIAAWRELATADLIKRQSFPPVRQKAADRVAQPQNAQFLPRGAPLDNSRQPMRRPTLSRSFFRGVAMATSQSHSSSSHSSGSHSSGTRKGGAEDQRHQDHGQGEVKHPESDHRLKEHRDSAHASGSRKEGMEDQRHQDHGQGEVKHPESDRRLKENRDSTHGHGNK